MDGESYVAEVDKVVPDGKHGPYAVAYCEQLGQLISFSLERASWEEKRWPSGGSIVVLTDLEKKRLGWRANKGRFFRPSDERLAAQQQKQHQKKRRIQK